MRVTQSVLVGNFLSNLNNNMREMDRIGQQLSTGKKINRPSDDPVAVVTSLRLRSSLTETEKYLDNVDRATSWLTATDIALGNAGDILQRVRELTVYGATDTLSPQSRDALAQEVEQLRQQLLQVANTTHEGLYIFSGFKTDTPAFDDAGVYNTGSGDIEYEIGIHIRIPINVTGDAAFEGAGNVFDLLTQIRDNLANGDSAALSGTDLANVEKAIDNILTLRSGVGAKTNRLDLTKNRLEDSDLNLSSLLSKNEDINTAEVITDLKMQENVYRTSLAAGARIIQPTLLDFLR